MIKHNDGVDAYFHNHLSPNLSQWKEGNHDSYLWLRVNKGVAFDLFINVVYVTLHLFICMVYVAPINSKNENESLFQNLVAYMTHPQAP